MRRVPWRPGSARAALRVGTGGVREILHRALYQGVIVWDKTRKGNPWGQAQRSNKPAAEWLRIDAPALRIVEEPLWTAAQTRLDDARQAYLRGTNGRLWGRPGQGVESKYLDRKSVV